MTNGFLSCHVFSFSARSVAAYRILNVSIRIGICPPAAAAVVVFLTGTCAFCVYVGVVITAAVVVDMNKHTQITNAKCAMHMRKYEMCGNRILCAPL